jgi:hypothetical protein
LWRHGGDGKRRWSPASPDFGKELFTVVETLLCPAPRPNAFEIDGLMASDCELHALTIATAIESGEPVATRISRRQRDIVCYRLNVVAVNLCAPEGS